MGCLKYFNIKTMNMKTLSCLLCGLIATFCISFNVYSQELNAEQREKISSEILTAFEKSIKAAENLNAKLLADCVDDTLSAGFIVGGTYFASFEEVMADFEKKAEGCKTQKLNVTNKKITVLGEDSALLVASGNYSLYLEDGRTLTGKFAWSMVYSKMNDEWKIIQANM